MVYIILIVVLFLFSIPEFNKNLYRMNANGRYYVAIVMVICGVLMGIRGNNVGLDTHNYINLYNDVKRFPMHVLLKDFYWGSVECGFVILNKLSSLIYNDYRFSQLVFSFIYYLCSYKFLVNNVKGHRIASLLFVAIGMFLFPLNITRQMLAIVIAINSFTYVRQSRYILAIIVILIAATIHATGLLGLIIPMSYYLKDKKGFVKLLPFVSVAVIICYPIIVAYVASFTDKYASYYDNDRGTASVNLGILVWIIISVLSLYIVYSKKFSTEQKLTANFALFCVVTGLIGTVFNYFERVGYIFIPFQIMVYLDIGHSIKNSSVKKIYFGGLCFCYMLLFIMSSKSPQYEYYTFF